MYLVAGGIDAGFKNTFSSTEVYREGRWSTVGPLPAMVHGLKGVTVDNIVFMTGEVLIHGVLNLILLFVGGFNDFEDFSDIWQYDPETEAWALAIYMRGVRTYHAVTAVNYDDFCY